jgi:hypothetical protein
MLKKEKKREKNKGISTGYFFFHKKYKKGKDLRVLGFSAKI